MIVKEFRNHVWASILRCDICLEPIEDIEASYVYWMTAVDDVTAVIIGPHIVHRYPVRRCDVLREKTYESARRNTDGGLAGIVLSEATHEHLLSAMLNAGCDVPDALERARRSWSWM